MENDFSRQASQTKDKVTDDVRSAAKQGEQKVQEFAKDAQKTFKQGQEELGKVIERVDQQLHQNPWPIVASVAVGSLLLGILIGTSTRK